MASFHLALGSSGSTIFIHSSANSMNSGSSIANFIAFLAFSELSTVRRNSRRWGFLSKSFSVSLLPTKIFRINTIALVYAFEWKKGFFCQEKQILTQFSQFLWINGVFGCELQYRLFCFVRRTFLLNFSRRWDTINIFVDFEAVKRTAKNIQSCQKLKFSHFYYWKNEIHVLFVHSKKNYSNTHQYSLHRGHLYFLVFVEHSMQFILILRRDNSQSKSNQNNVRFPVKKKGDVTFQLNFST